MNIQVIWFQEEFSTGEAIARPDVWELMIKVFGLLRVQGVDGVSPTLDDLDGDYEQLADLFFGDATEAWNGEYLPYLVTVASEPVKNDKGKPTGAKKTTKPEVVSLAWYAATGQIDMNKITPCKLWELHKVSPRKKLVEIDSRLSRERFPETPTDSPEKLQPTTSLSSPAATANQTPSET